MKQKISRLKRGVISANIALEISERKLLIKGRWTTKKNPGQKVCYTSMNFKVAKNAHEPTFTVFL